MKIIYWKNEKNSNVLVHKNGEFFRTFNGIEDAKRTLKNYNYELNFKGDYIAQTGCIVEEYSMIKKEKIQEKDNKINIEDDKEISYDID